MNARWRKRALTLAPGILAAFGLHANEPRDAVAPASEIPHVNASEWPIYNHGYDGRRFSDLTQINAQNAAELHEICRLRTGDFGSFQTGPILVDGFIYVTTARGTMALNPANCEIVWKSIYTPEQKEAWTSNRGAGSWQGRIIRGTTDARLLAYDAKTGKELWKAVVGDPLSGEQVAAAPVAWNGMVYVGLYGGDNGIKGRFLAFDASTGRPMWQFNLVPQDGEAGSETWKDTSYEHGGGGSWSSVALDPDTAELFVPVGNPAPDLDQAPRKGLNLYTNSIVVLDANTGKLKWFYQLTPFDDHDHDLGAAPMLYSMANDRKVVAAGSKDGYLYVVDRRTHKLMFKTAVVPIKNADASPSVTGTVVCPGIEGGVEWNGPALDLTNHAIVIGAVDWCTKFFLKSEEFVRGEGYFHGRWEMVPPAIGRITSLDASTGRIRWNYQTPSPVVAAVTPTAGDVTFAGDLAGNLYVLQSSNGHLLKKIDTGGAIAGGIITYTVDSRQFVAVTSGNISRATFGAVGIPTLVLYSVGPTEPPGGPLAQVWQRDSKFGAATRESSAPAPIDLTAGKQTYDHICSACHGVSREGGTGPMLADVSLRLTYDQILGAIMNPKGRMPTLYPSILKEADVINVASYIRNIEAR